MNEEDNKFELERKQEELADLRQKCQRLINENEILQQQKLRIEDKINDKRQQLEQKLTQRGAQNQPNQQHHQKPDVDKREKQIKNWVKQKLLRQLLGANQNSEELLDMQTKYQKQEPLIIQSVTIKYIENLQDGDKQNFQRSNPREANFKINKSTTFKDLKQSACDFWKIPLPKKMGLRAVNYSLMDLMIKQKIEQTVLQLRIPPEFWLFQKNPGAVFTFTEVKECFIDPHIASEFLRKKASKNVKRGQFRQKDHLQAFKAMETMYPGLTKYKPPQIDLQTDEIERQRKYGRYASFLTSIILIIGLLATLLIMIFRRDVNTDYWMQSGIHSDHLLNYDPTSNYFDISTKAALHLFIQNVIANVYFQSALLPSPNLLDRFYLSGPIRFRQTRSKQKERCDQGDDFNLNQQTVCFYSQYNQDTKQTRVLNNGEYQFQNYKDSSQTKIDYVYEGEFSIYDGSGYIWDVNVNDWTKQDFVQFYSDNIKNGNWFNGNTRSLFINANLFATNYDKFVPVFIAFQFTVSGYVYPSKLAAYVIRTNLYNLDKAEDIVCLICEIIRGFVAFYCLFLYIKCSLDRNESTGERKLYHLYSIKGILDLFIGILILIALIIGSLLTVEHSEIFGDEYYDLQVLTSYYINHLVVNAWVMLLLMFRMISIFNIARKVHIFLLTLEFASVYILCLMVIMIPLLIGLLVVTLQVWGPFLFNYRSLDWAILSNILFTLGHGDIEELLEVSETWTIVFFIFYFFVIVFYLFSAFLGVLIDAYRQVRMRNDVIQKQIKDSGDDFGIRDWIKHSCRCCRKKQMGFN